MLALLNQSSSGTLLTSYLFRDPISAGLDQLFLNIAETVLEQAETDARPVSEIRSAEKTLNRGTCSRDYHLKSR
jgi:hypothetical protein